MRNLCCALVSSCCRSSIISERRVTCVWKLHQFVCQNNFMKYMNVDECTFFSNTKNIWRNTCVLVLYASQDSYEAFISSRSKLTSGFSFSPTSPRSSTHILGTEKDPEEEVDNFIKWNLLRQMLPNITFYKNTYPYCCKSVFHVIEFIHYQYMRQDC